MKKQIALIIISALAAMPATAQNVNQNEVCNYKPKTPICEMGSGVIQPDLEEIFGLVPTHPNHPDVEVKPDIPDIPDIPDTPDIPDIPDVPDAPDIPIIPDTPDTPVIPDTPESDSQMPEGSYASRVLSLVNAERARYGLSPLTYDVRLANAAEIRAKEIKTYFSHTRPDGSSCFTVLDNIGYDYKRAGENIAYGQKTPTEVVSAWMNSEGHRANILGDYDYIGIGVYESGGTIYWSQMFAS